MYIEEGNDHNEKVVAEIFPHVKSIIIWMTMGRIILLLISCKKPSICKIYLYYQVLFIVVELCLPRDYGDV